MHNALREVLRNTSIGIAKKDAAQQQWPHPQEQRDEHHLSMVMASILSPLVALSSCAPSTAGESARDVLIN
jgi:hypothetical protein